MLYTNANFEGVIRAEPNPALHTPSNPTHTPKNCFCKLKISLKIFLQILKFLQYENFLSLAFLKNMEKHIWVLIGDS